MKLKEWKDRRSGPVGCLAGNIVLDSIQLDGEELRRLKGTIFYSEKRLIVGRACSSTEYLVAPFVHFCNLTPTHHRNLLRAAQGKSAYYLLLTVRGKEIHYWFVPHKVMGTALRRAKPKKSDSACIIRVRERAGKYDILGVDITDCHKFLVVNPSLVRQLAEAERTTPKDQNATIKVSSDSDKTAKVSLKYTDGRYYEGTLRIKPAAPATRAR